ncbi:winged helix-turn-helix transcriptional regulator [Herbiconiux sp. P16]|uniref:winged helix-turn-helix transcriptional regulator n=1 Tax=Herbiconiux wuyangfengii TaxID=3342794 RepID=UPI0035B70264
MLSEPTSARRDDGTRVCSIADALDLVGDRWSLLVIREVQYGVQRFNDIQRLTGAPRQILTARLRKLEQVGVLVRTRYSSSPPRYEYELTKAGDELSSVLRDLRLWGERFATPQLESGSPSAA